MERIFDNENRTDAINLLVRFIGALQGEEPLSKNEAMRLDNYCEANPAIKLFRERLDEPDPERKWEPTPNQIHRARRFDCLKMGFDVTTGRSLPLGAMLKSILVRLLLKVGFKPSHFFKKIMQ